MNAAKVVLGLYLAANLVLGLVRIGTRTKVDDPVDVTSSAAAAVVTGIVFAGLFAALAYA